MRTMRQRDDERADTDLVARSQSGDDLAFAELYRRHAGAVRRAVSDNVHDHDRQDELLEEVFAKGWANIGKPM